MDDNSNTKKITRKKLVDLKAVAALLDEDTDSPKGRPASYTANEALIQETSRIKGQRDLIRQRVDKMLQSKGRVSKSVFDKVQRDYSMQLQTINELLNEKKTLLKKELKDLYMLREKQNVEIKRHKEILEEAQFRHFLNEFTEEQYKEVEEYEAKEILHLQNELAKIHAFIKLHEELFDPVDLGGEPEPTRPPPSQEVKPSRAPLMNDLIEKTPIPEFDKTPLPPFAPQEDVILKEAPLKGSTEPAQGAEEISDYILSEGSEAGYFTETPLPPSPDSFSETMQIDKTLIKHDPLPEKEDSTKSSVSSSSLLKPEKEPESILDIIEESAGTPGAPSFDAKTPIFDAVTPAPPLSESAANQGTLGYKLVFTDGDTGIKELPLKDNVSIGRSPSNDLVLQTPKISRQHAAINKYKDRYILIDLKSSNGVFVNGRKVDEHTLQEGDEISMAGYKMIFKKA